MRTATVFNFLVEATLIGSALIALTLVLRAPARRKVGCRLLMLLWALIARVTGSSVAGWTSLMGSIWLIGGIQLLSLGVVGEYVGKIYKEAKHRPRFIIESVLNK